MKQWLPIENEIEYREATTRLEEIYDAQKGSPHYREMLLLSLLVSTYEKQHFQLPDLDPIEYIRTRMDELHVTSADLARIYGDKGTISKVLNYKQALSLTMIRKFSAFLRIPPDFLIKEYKLRA